MEVKFDLVRIGKKRNDLFKEKMIKHNLDILRSNIRSLFKNKTCNNKNNQISMIMVIPGRGYKIKIHFQNISEKWIKKELKDNYPNSIYKGKYEILLDNLDNKVF